MSTITPMGAGFISHVEMALINDATQLLSDRGAAYQKNLVEKVGDVLSYYAIKLPFEVLNYLQDSRVITIACTALTMVAVQFGFYPVISIIFVKNACVYLISQVPLWTIKFTAYLIVQTGILGIGLRALG